MNSFSTAANLPLPRWAYVPGESADAEADHDTLWHAKALVPSRFRDFVPARHPARACIQIASANLKLRMQKPHAAARLLGEALVELKALGARRAAGAGGGFADGFQTAALAALLTSRLQQSPLSKADWVAIGTVSRT
jgi:hypothetical protein